MKHTFQRILVLLMMALAFTMMVPNRVYAGEETFGVVEKRSVEEVTGALKKVRSLDTTPSYSTKPVTTSPYKAGALTEKVQKNALAYLNAIRYIAGIPSDVRLSEEYEQKAQAAALLDAVNNQLSHYPTKPSGMDDSLYQLGAAGASHSNLSRYPGSSVSLETAIDGWISDSNNVTGYNQGHRRWLLDPALEYTGFGSCNGYSAVYVSGGQKSNNTSYTGVTWPAQTMPVELISSGDAWSISFGRTLSADAISVTLTRERTGDTWTYDSASAAGTFSVDNTGYGQKGCVIFTPPETDYRHGETWHVTVSENGTAIASYDVDFFSLEGASYNQKYSDITNANIKLNVPETGYLKYTGSRLKPKVTVKLHGVTLKKGTDYKVTYSNNISGKSNLATVKITGIGECTGTRTLKFVILKSDVPKVTWKKSGALTTKSGSLTASWNKKSGDGYMIQVASESDFSDAITYYAATSTTKQTVTGLTKGQKYYVRIRTIKFVSYYNTFSTWSAAKSITIK